MSSEVPRQVFDQDMLRTRLRDYNVVVYQIASSLVQSGVLALAAIVLIDILYAERNQTVLLFLWLSSFVFAVVAFERQLYLPLATPRGGVSDVWPLMLLGLAEFLNFACLLKRENGDAPWELWYFTQGACAIMGLAAVWQAQRFATLDDYAADSKHVGQMFAEWLRQDLRELIGVVGVSVSFCVVLASEMLSENGLFWMTLGAALINIVANSALVHRDGRRFWKLYSTVYNLSSPAAAERRSDPASSDAASRQVIGQGDVSPQRRDGDISGEESADKRLV